MGEAESRAPGQPTNALLAAALDLAARGWPVFPLQPESKVPLRGSRGCLEATCAAATIARWWQRWPRANIAVATGRELVVLDEDTYKGARTEDWTLPATLTVATARGGRHWYFACADPLASLPEGQLGPGIGLKARGGYVVAPPSRYRGAPYRWVDVAQPVAPLPATVRARIAASRAASGLPLSGYHCAQQPAASRHVHRSGQRQQNLIRRQRWRAAAVAVDPASEQLNLADGHGSGLSVWHSAALIGHLHLNGPTRTNGRFVGSHLGIVWPWRTL
jgi:hypothetical protein